MKYLRLKGVTEFMYERGIYKALCQACISKDTSLISLANGTERSIVLISVSNTYSLIC